MHLLSNLGQAALYGDVDQRKAMQATKQRNTYSRFLHVLARAGSAHDRFSETAVCPLHKAQSLCDT